MALNYDLALNIEGVQAALGAGSERGALLGAEHVLQVSNAHVPHEIGTLELSGRATPDESDGTVCYVSYDTPYAVRQHEELEWQHDEGRTAKYLERAMLSEQAQVRQI